MVLLFYKMILTKWMIASKQYYNKMCYWSFSYDEELSDIDMVKCMVVEKIINFTVLGDFEYI